MEFIDSFLANYGYLAIFLLLMLGIVGPLIPDDTILVASGIAAHAGKLHWATTIAVAYAGSVCGISLSYALGRSGLLRVIERWPLAHRWVGRHLPVVEHWFGRYGKWTLFFGYFVAGLRHFTALTAGISRLDLRQFMLYAYPGGLLWVVSFVSIGYFLGDQWEHLHQYFERGAVFALVALIAVAGAIWWWRARKKGRPASGRP